MEPPNSPPPNWLLLPDNVTVAIFDFFNPGKLLSLRQVCTQWQRLTEASALTRKKLVLMQCGCIDNGNCNCSLELILSTCPDRFFYFVNLNTDGTPFVGIKNNHIALHIIMNGIRCRSFDWKKAQLLARLFPQISHFTVVHTSITAGHLDHICYLLTQWSPTLAAFKFHSHYTLDNPDKRLTRSLTVGTATAPTEAYLNSQLTHFFTQLKSLPELKHLTLHYLKGKINSTVASFAFLPRLEELQFDRRSLEENLQTACQRYLAPPVLGGPPLVLRRFTHNATQNDATASEFTRFLQYSPDALPLTTVSSWNQQISIPSMNHIPDFLLRFRSISFLDISHIPGIALGPLSRSLSSHNVATLYLSILENNAVEEDDMLPVPSVIGLTIALHSPDHGRFLPLLAQIPTVFPRLSSLFLMDCRSQCYNAPSGPTFSATPDEPPELARFATELLAAYPHETESVKYLQVNSFLYIIRQINNTFPALKRTFSFIGQPSRLNLGPRDRQ